MTFEPATVYKKIEALDRTEVPDGYVIYDEPRQQVHFLNLTAAAVFELCDGRTDLNGIAAALQDAFDLSDPPIAEVEACVASLLSQGLIEHCSPSSSET